jgi:hypothetical protein
LGGEVERGYHELGCLRPTPPYSLPHKGRE